MSVVHVYLVYVYIICTTYIYIYSWFMCACTCIHICSVCVHVNIATWRQINNFYYFVSGSTFKVFSHLLAWDILYSA